MRYVEPRYARCAAAAAAMRESFACAAALDAAA